MIRVISFIALLACGAALFWWQSGEDDSFPEDVRQQLTGRGRVLVLGDPALLQTIEGAEAFPANGPIEEALEGIDGEAFAAALVAANVEAVLIEKASGSVSVPAANVRERLLSYDYFSELRGRALSPEFAVYVPSLASLRTDARAVSARIARGILEGKEPPRIGRFPMSMREIESVEVMVLLRDRGRPRLWRSARGSSVARALVTASTVARQRWTERQEALGGPLSVRLPFLDVEISLLEEDGTLVSRSESFIESVFHEGHGVAYAQPGAWRYLLPDATREAGGGSAIAAYRDLFSNNALEAESFERPELRFYRLTTTPLGTSSAPLGPGPDRLSPNDFDLDEDDALVDPANPAAPTP